MIKTIDLSHQAADSGFGVQDSRTENATRKNAANPILVSLKPNQQIYWRGSTTNPLTY